MHFDLETLPSSVAYNLLTATVTPRPIAWVTTLSEKGTVNAAPFSFFNVMGHQPPTVAFGLMRRANGTLKDTAANIIDNKEFVVNLVPESLVHQMNQTCADYPPESDELSLAGVKTRPASKVRPPIIEGSPVVFECVSHAAIVTGPSQVVVIGRVLGIHVADDVVEDAERGYVDAPQLGLVSRMHGRGWYARSTDLFQVERFTLPDRQAS